MLKRRHSKSDISTHHTPSEHQASVNIVQMHCSMSGKKCTELSLQDRQLIIGCHCHSIQPPLLHACQIGCLATHRINLLSCCSFVAFTPTTMGKGAGTLGREVCLTVMHLLHPECGVMPQKLTPHSILVVAVILIIKLRIVVFFK